MKLEVHLTLVVLTLIIPLAVQGSKGVRAILSVSHVTQHGNETRETRIHVMRDHMYYLEVVKQTQPSGRTNCKQFIGVLSDDNFQRITLLIDSSQFQGLRTSQELVRPGESSDIWYVAVHRKETQFLVFGDRHSRPPENLVNWFEESKHLKPLRSVATHTDNDQCSVFSEAMAGALRR
jgi:hypothetical protein